MTIIAAVTAVGKDDRAWHRDRHHKCGQ